MNTDSHDYHESNNGFSTYWKSVSSVISNSIIAAEIIPEATDDLSAYCELKEYISHSIISEFEYKNYTSCGVLFIHDINYISPEGRART